MSSEIRIQFKSSEGRVEDLNQINQLLATMELTDVDVEELEVYLCTT